MSFNLRNKSLLDLKDFAPRDIRFLLDLAAELKRSKYAGTERPRLIGKNIVLIFEKASTRTRCSFEVAMYDQGGHVTFLDSVGSHIGHKESIKDTARVLGRLYDGIEYRGFKQSVVEELARYSHVPVWNGLTDEAHPTQILADLLTMEEFGEKPLRECSKRQNTCGWQEINLRWSWMIPCVSTLEIYSSTLIIITIMGMATIPWRIIL